MKTGVLLFIVAILWAWIICGYYDESNGRIDVEKGIVVFKEPNEKLCPLCGVGSNYVQKVFFTENKQKCTSCQGVWKKLDKESN